MASRCYSHGKQETDEEFDARWVTYFNKPDIDAWELRKGTFKDDSEAESVISIVKFKTETEYVVSNSCRRVKDKEMFLLF